MSNGPDPQTVREGVKYPDTAWGRIRAYLDNATAVLQRVDLGELLAENVQLKRKLEWPAEQPQDAQPERDGDSAAEAGRRFADAWAQHDNRRGEAGISRDATFLVSGGDGATARLTEPQLRSILDTREQWRNLALSRGAKQDDDVRAVAAYLAASHEDAPPADPHPRTALERHFADRIAALDARDAKAGGER